MEQIYKAVKRRKEKAFFVCLCSRGRCNSGQRPRGINSHGNATGLPNKSLSLEKEIVQGFTIRPLPGLVNFVPAIAYHFCLNLHAAFSQPGNSLIYWSPVDICILNPMILPVGGARLISCMLELGTARKCWEVPVTSKKIRKLQIAHHVIKMLLHRHVGLTPLLVDHLPSHLKLSTIVTLYCHFKSSFSGGISKFWTRLLLHTLQISWIETIGLVVFHILW